MSDAGTTATAEAQGLAPRSVFRGLRKAGGIGISGPPKSQQNVGDCVLGTHSAITAHRPTPVHVQCPPPRTCPSASADLWPRGGGVPDQQEWRTQPSQSLWGSGSPNQVCLRFYTILKQVGLESPSPSSGDRAALELQPRKRPSQARGLSGFWARSASGNRGQEVPRPALLPACLLPSEPGEQGGLAAGGLGEGRGRGSPPS